MSKAIARLGKELKAVQDEFPPGVIDIHVCDSNLHELLFLVAGPEKTNFEGGVYVLKIDLPKNYPYSPPDFLMYTPNGRFAPGAKICTSFSTFHPETWSPAYTINTLVVSFISFFSDEQAPAAGVVNESPATRKHLARESAEWGRKSQYSKKLKVLTVLKKGKQTAASLAEATAKIHGCDNDAENRHESRAGGSRAENSAAPSAGPSRHTASAAATKPACSTRETTAKGTPVAAEPFTVVGGSTAQRRSPVAVRKQVERNATHATIDLTAGRAKVTKKKRPASESIDLTAGSSTRAAPKSSAKVTKKASAVVDLT